MIEARVMPALLIMAIVTSVAKICPVWVYLAMTRQTVGWGLAAFCVRQMALLAKRLQMASTQQEIGPFMFKCLLIKRHDLSVAAFMLRMTFAAGVLFEAAVIPLLISNIDSDVFVAVEA